MADENEQKPAGVFLKLAEKEQEAIKKLITIEPELTKIVEGKKAWAIISEIVKKAAIFLSTISAGFLVLREIVKAMHG